ncbi:DUF397 domain-containing protein [Streptomyces sp. NPDC126497]|uniref:DUF397 domain-containing protein n=1 Tax=Streptomyces sp. NPDC126497 TaxID=3155313 RepID=UPI003330176C
MHTSELGWSKSGYSSAQGDDRVEIAVTEQAIHARGSKDVTRRPSAVGRGEWAHFVAFAAQA